MDYGGHCNFIFEYFTIVTLSNSSEVRIAASVASVPPAGASVINRGTGIPKSIVKILKNFFHAIYNLDEISCARCQQKKVTPNKPCHKKGHL